MGRDGIFISYRRADVAFHADWLHSHLVRSFGAARVFRDLDSIALGADYTHAIDRALESCSHLVAVIGPRWVDLMREGVQGPRDDLLGTEIRTALDRGLEVIPVLFEGTPMPREADLPPSLSNLARRQALSVARVADGDTLVRKIMTAPDGGRAPDGAWPAVEVPVERVAMPELAGAYLIASSSQPGAAGGYRGRVEITAGPAAYRLDWTIGDGDRQVGVGLVEGTRLAVGWGSAQSRPEVAVYRRTELGLVGRRVERTPGRPTIRRERLVGRPDDRLGIAGTIEHFASAEASAVVAGVGLTLDGEDAVAVGWGSDVGVAVYSLSGPELRGRWAAAGGTYVGSEVLVRT